jgi:hypothetical protein
VHEPPPAEPVVLKVHAEVEIPSGVTPLVHEPPLVELAVSKVHAEVEAPKIAKSLVQGSKIHAEVDAPSVVTSLAHVVVDAPSIVTPLVYEPPFVGPAGPNLHAEFDAPRVEESGVVQWVEDSVAHVDVDPPSVAALLVHGAPAVDDVSYPVVGNAVSAPGSCAELAAASVVDKHVTTSVSNNTDVPRAEMHGCTRRVDGGLDRCPEPHEVQGGREHDASCMWVDLAIVIGNAFDQLHGGCRCLRAQLLAAAGGSWSRELAGALEQGEASLAETVAKLLEPIPAAPAPALVLLAERWGECRTLLLLHKLLFVSLDRARPRLLLKFLQVHEEKWSKGDLQEFAACHLGYDVSDSFEIRMQES